MSVIVANDTTDSPGAREPAGPAMHDLTLSFPLELEREFKRDYFRKSVRQVRIGQIVGAGVYGAFAVIDPWVIPSVVSEVWVIRAVVIACLGLVFAASYTRGFESWMQPAVTGVILVAGLGLLGMM